MHCVKLLGQRLAASTSGRSGLRPSGCGVPGSRRHSQRLHRARHTRHRRRGISLSGGKGNSVHYLICATEPRTDLEMQLEYGDQIENSLLSGRKVPPQVVLSEGQLAANGFSILCAASTAYRWSSWPALLLDDPLQHNDIIHTAAFVDVMRNLVELENYQIIMSSCSIPDDHIDPRRSALFMARSVLREARDGDRTC